MSSKASHSRELAILRKAVDKAEKQVGRAFLRQNSTKRMIEIVEQFLVSKKLVCYGGTAINNILPTGSQFYDKMSEIPDYDFFSPNALDDAKALADLYIAEGYQEVEARAALHFGTYKVYVDFTPIADITNLPSKLFKALKEKAIIVDGVRYAPPDYLRMSMYAELSHPQGETSRWEKVLRRLFLLNEHYPMENPRCTARSFARRFEGKRGTASKVFRIVKDSAIQQKLVFFGSYAASVYNTSSKRKRREPDFDLLSPEPRISAEIMVDDLKGEGLQQVAFEKHRGLGEVVPPHYQVSVGSNTVAFIYKTMACHNYNEIAIDGHKIRIATIDTMLSLYLAFLYDDAPHYDPARIYCMAQYLFQVQQKGKLQQRGVLRRFVPSCIGTQDTVVSMRSKKGAMFKEIDRKKDARTYDSWFLNYNPKPRKTVRKTVAVPSTKRSGTAIRKRTRTRKRASAQN